MKGNFIFLMAFVASAFLFATGGSEKTASNDYVEMYAGEVTTMNYLVSGSENEHYMFTNTIDSLVEYDKYGIMKPGLAESWTVSDDGLTYTFNIRKGVKWYTNEGTEYGETTAQDWVDAAKYILNKENASKTANVLYGVVAGAKAYFEGESTDFSTVGVKAVDKYVLQYTLSKPVPYFLSMLTYVSFLPLNGEFLAQVGDSFGTDNTTVLYNGAYIMETFEPQVTRVLVKNRNYWDAKNVFIPRLIYKYNKEAQDLGPELFLRGETSWTMVSSDIIDSWMNDPVKEAQVHPYRTSAYTYFYAFNFNVNFDKEYEPENWKIAVNNRNFRKSLFHALNREAAMATLEPYTPSRRLSNTITPPFFANVNGMEYTQMGPLKAIADRDTFDSSLAKDYKAKAMAELKGKVTFPVKVMMPYSTGKNDWIMRVQVVEQQMEKELGSDYIDIIPVPFPATGFLNATRRAGNYAMEEVNWGPDYADPETYTDPFVAGSNYNWVEMAEGYGGAYDKLVEEAKAETTDLVKRYELFAKAEAYLIDEAFVLPYSVGGGGFEATTMEPFTRPYAPFGMSMLKYKGMKILDSGYSTAVYAEKETAWKAERDKALGAVK